MRDSLAHLELMDFTIQVVLGTLLAALVPVVGFNAVMTSEHFASFLVSIIADTLTDKLQLFLANCLVNAQV